MQCQSELSELNRHLFEMLASVVSYTSLFNAKYLTKSTGKFYPALKIVNRIKTFCKQNKMLERRYQTKFAKHTHEKLPKVCNSYMYGFNFIHYHCVLITTCEECRWFFSLSLLWFIIFHGMEDEIDVIQSITKSTTTKKSENILEIKMTFTPNTKRK